MDESQITEVENRVMQSITADFPNVKAWWLDKATLWRISPDLTVRMLAARGDVYELMLMTPKGHTQGDTYALMTTGWAAPADTASETAPSRHPERRRVRLLVVAELGGIASLLRFEDKPDNFEYDDGTSARGALADALADFYERVAGA